MIVIEETIMMMWTLRYQGQPHVDQIYGVLGWCCLSQLATCAPHPCNTNTHTHKNKLHWQTNIYTEYNSDYVQHQLFH